MNHWTIQASADVNHPNRLPFTGILTYLDEPSDKAPMGARSHRVILTKKAAQAALGSLIGMAVDFKDEWDGHNNRQKCGVITEGLIDDNKLVIKGFIYGRDFQDIVMKLTSPEKPLGMSYELADAHVEDMRAQIWTLTRATFTGAAILFAEKAAYRNTTFNLVESSLLAA